MATSTTTVMPNPYVRVTGTLDERFVEFEFSIGDPVLAAELVLPFEQFHEFCERHCVRHINPDDGPCLEYERMKWRFGALDDLDC